MPTKKSKPKPGTIRIPKDDGGGGGNVRVPEGDYHVKITEIKQDTSQAGNAKIVISYKGLDGALKGKVLKEHMAITAKTGWRVRNWIRAIGATVPENEFDLPFAKMVGKEVGVTLQDDSYTNNQGKTVINSKVSDYLSLDDLAGAEEEDDEDADEEEEDTDEETDKDNDDEEEVEEELEDLDLDSL